jgi:hypothetical protein
VRKFLALVSAVGLSSGKMGWQTRDVLAFRNGKVIEE